MGKSCKKSRRDLTVPGAASGVPAAGELAEGIPEGAAPGRALGATQVAVGRGGVGDA